MEYDESTMFTEKEQQEGCIKDETVEVQLRLLKTMDIWLIYRPINYFRRVQINFYFV